MAQWQQCGWLIAVTIIQWVFDPNYNQSGPKKGKKDPNAPKLKMKERASFTNVTSVRIERFVLEFECV